MIISAQTMKDGIWWIAFSVLSLIAATAAYLLYARDPLAGTSGGSLIGLIFGGAGFAMITFCMLLNLRKYFRSLRVGSVYGWMQGHVWIGLLSYPIILFHAGFHWGGPLTCVLMWLFTVVEVTGVTGLVLQTFLPRQMFDTLARETIYREIDHLVQQQINKARAIVRSFKTTYDRLEGGGTASGGVATAAEPVDALETFYRQTIEPCLASQSHSSSSGRSLRAEFDAFRRGTLPKYPAVADLLGTALGELETLVQEQNNFGRQRRLHHVLHAWLLLHVPLSYAMYLLAIAHGVMALRY